MLSLTQKLIIRKDLEVFSRSFLACIVSGVIFTALFSLERSFFAILGSILIITVMLGYYPYLVTSCVTREYKEKNTVFVMSLPITAKEYLVSKVFSCSSLYLGCWFTLLLATLSVFFISGHLPAIMPAYFIVLFGMFIPAFLLTLLVAILSESEGWTIVAFIFSNISVTILINIMPNLPVMQVAFGMGSISQVGALWPPFINYFLVAESGISISLVLILSACVSRKRQLTSF